MRALLLDGSNWRNEENFYRAFLRAVKAPKWHRHNLDALQDSLIVGSINEVSPPFTVTVRGSRTWPDSLATFVGEVDSIFHEARSEGVQVDLVLSEQ